MKNLPLPARFGQQMGITSQLYIGLMSRIIEPHGLTYAQFTVLLHLARRKHPTRVSDMARAVELNQPAVTKVVQKFIANGWAETTPDASDQRSRQIAITDAGRTHIAEVQQSFGPMFARLLDGWSEDHLDRFIADLQTLTNTLETLKNP
ncbi:MarR family winged helix-turn-helix transcriptional regulator [Rhodobacteraceae bacterium D3-12]|nr:MarR family winged helix-turn-helix transcriptional regulator [Rhodobacteraceae bacterium D3-12]